MYFGNWCIKLTLFLLFIMILALLMYFGGLIANNVDPDQTASLAGFIVFTSMTELVWIAFEKMQQT